MCFLVLANVICLKYVLFFCIYDLLKLCTFLIFFVKQQKTNKKKFSAFSNTKNSLIFGCRKFESVLGQT
eukprot:UN19875